MRLSARALGFRLGGFAEIATRPLLRQKSDKKTRHGERGGARSPDVSSRGAEPLNGLALGPRVVRPLGEIERGRLDGSLLDAVEHLEQQLRRDRLRADEEAVEGLVGPD